MQNKQKKKKKKSQETKIGKLTKKRLTENTHRGKRHEKKRKEKIEKKILFFIKKKKGTPKPQLLSKFHSHVEIIDFSYLEKEIWFYAPEGVDGENLKEKFQLNRWDEPWGKRTKK